MCDCTLVCSYSQKLIRAGVRPASGCVYEAIGLLIDVVLRYIEYLCFVPQMPIMVPSAVVCLELSETVQMCIRLIRKANHRDTNQLHSSKLTL